MKRTNLLASVLSSALLLGIPGVARADEPPPPASPPAATPPEDRVPASVAVVYPLATNANRPEVTSSADLSLLYGRVGKIEGLQLGAVAMHASDGVRGAQIGGVSTTSGGPVKGLQLSGAVAVSTSEVEGAQVSPVNVAGAVDGVQVGIVNVGGKVRGLQLGIVNVADDVDGASIGLVSISRDSVHPIVWASNLQNMNVGVKFATKYVFTLIGAHYGTLEEEFDNVGLTAGIGGRIPLPAHFDLEIMESFTQTAPRNRDGSKGNSWIAHQAIAGYSLAPHLRIFAGGGVRQAISVEIGRDVTRPEVLAGVQF